MAFQRRSNEPPTEALPDNLYYLSDARERLDNGCRLALVEAAEPEPVAIDDIARERAEDWISEFATNLDRAGQYLHALAGFVRDERSLGAAVVDDAGVKLSEMRERVATLRQVVRDIPSMPDNAA